MLSRFNFKGHLEHYSSVFALFFFSKAIVFTLAWGIPRWTPHQVSWKSWDANIYLEIAKHGYSFKGQPPNPDVTTPNSIAFFPLYPMLIRYLHFLLPLQPLTIGLLLSALFSLLCGLSLYDLAFRWRGKKVAQLSVLFFLFSPGSIFLSAVYTESLFCLCVTLCLRAIYLKQIPLASLWLGLATVTRLPGIALHPAFWIGLFTSASSPFTIMYSSLLSVFPLFLFMLFQYKAFGTYFAFIQAQDLGWQRHLDWPWKGIKALWEYGGQYQAFHVDLVFLAIIVMILISGRKKLPIGFSIYSWSLVGLSICTSWPMSVTRILITIIPFYLILADTVQKNKVAYVLVSFITVVWGLVGSYYYLTGGMFL